MMFLGKKFPYWMYFGQGQDLTLSTELSEKVQYSRNQAQSLPSTVTPEETRKLRF